MTITKRQTSSRPKIKPKNIKQINKLNQAQEALIAIIDLHGVEYPGLNQFIYLDELDNLLDEISQAIELLEENIKAKKACRELQKLLINNNGVPQQVYNHWGISYLTTYDHWSEIDKQHSQYSQMDSVVAEEFLGYYHELTQHLTSAIKLPKNQKIGVNSTSLQILNITIELGTIDAKANITSSPSYF